jgi:hypothetical protein
MQITDSAFRIDDQILAVKMIIFVTGDFRITHTEATISMFFHNQSQGLITEFPMPHIDSGDKGTWVAICIRSSGEILEIERLSKLTEEIPDYNKMCKF